MNRWKKNPSLRDRLFLTSERICPKAFFHKQLVSFLSCSNLRSFMSWQLCFEKIWNWTLLWMKIDRSWRRVLSDHGNPRSKRPCRSSRRHVNDLDFGGGGTCPVGGLLSLRQQRVTQEWSGKGCLHFPLPSRAMGLAQEDESARGTYIYSRNIPRGTILGIQCIYAAHIALGCFHFPSLENCSETERQSEVFN